MIPFIKKHTPVRIKKFVKKHLTKSYKERSTRLVEYEGGLFNLYSGSFIEELMMMGSCEPHISILGKYLIRQGDVVFDVGANIGLHTVPFSKAVGEEGAVFAFEPNRQNLRRLKLNLALSGSTNVTVHETAIAEKEGTFTFYECADESFNLGNHSLVKNETLKKFEQHETLYERVVHGDTIDNICSLHGKSPSLIKMDIEGYEYQALLGAKETLKKGTKVIMEFNLDRINALGLSVEHFKELFKDYDAYEIVKPGVYDDYSSLVPFNFDRHVVCDLLCLPKNLMGDKIN